MRKLCYFTLLVLFLAGCGAAKNKPGPKSNDDAPSRSDRQDSSSSAVAQNTEKRSAAGETEKQDRGFQSFESKFDEKGGYQGSAPETSGSQAKELAEKKMETPPVKEKPKSAEPKEPPATPKEASAVEGLPEPKSVEVRLDTPENALATYKDAYVYQDWKAMLRCLDQRSALGEIMNLAVLANVWIESGPPAVLADKYKIDWDHWQYAATGGGSGDFERVLKNVPDRAQFYADLANWLSTQLGDDRFSEMYRYRYYKRGLAWKHSKVQAWETDGDVATASVISPNPEDPSTPPKIVLFVFNKADGTWLLNQRESEDATLTYRQENIQASASLVAKMELSDGDAAVRVALSPKAETVVYTTVEGDVVAWDFASNTTRWKDTNPPEASGYGQKFPEAIAMSADGTTAAVAFSEEQNEENRPNSPIILFNLASGRRTAVLSGHNGPIKAVNFSTDATQLFSLGEDALCRVWDLKAKKQSRSFVFNAYEDESGQRVERAEYFWYRRLIRPYFQRFGRPRYFP